MAGGVNGLLDTPHEEARCSSRREMPRKSGRFSSIVISQHASESLAARHFTGGRAHFLASSDQFVAEPLVIALCVIMGRGTFGAKQKLTCALPKLHPKGILARL
jgi:hypothetical protein